MKPRWTKWGPIVYSALMGKERCIGLPHERGDEGQEVRLALLPVLDNEEQAQGPDFPCRVVFGDKCRAWANMSSCRGRDGGERDSNDGHIFFDNDAEAIEWLIAEFEE